jgi:hypothetical protein
MGRPSLILSFAVSYNQGGVILDQKRYLQGILQKWYGNNNATCRTPAETSLKLKSKQDNEEGTDITHYR